MMRRTSKPIVEKLSDVIDEIERTFHNMLHWETKKDLSNLKDLSELHIRIFTYYLANETAGNIALGEDEFRKAVEIRHNLNEPQERRIRCARLINDTINAEFQLVEAEVDVRRHILLMIYRERELELSRSLENS
jgi:hypothetical protein